VSIRPATNSAERERVGPYVLVKAIGAGGSARVDLARIERAYGFQRHVVIKRPLEHLRADPRAAESIRREARLGARLRHPNLVAILDAGVHDDYDYLVLDYVHGGALRTLMQADEASRVRDVSLDVALTIIRDVARGVHEAHELKDEHGAPLGLVHRDVSPGNVLIGLDGAVQLADFGIAKETRVATLSGSMHGTVTYMAPEQCRGHAFDRRADVFSIGVILYELVTGTRLFWADNDVASLHRVLAGTITRPRKVRAGIPQQLEDLIMNTLAPEQDKRLGTARALADALETYATEAGIILAARGVSRWAHELLGPRDQPWVGDQTQIDIALHLPPVDEALPSLVDVIEATPLPQALPVATFGPTQVGLFEDNPSDRGMMPYSAAAPEAEPKRRSRAILAVLVGASLVGGGTAAMIFSRGSSDPETAQPVASPVTDTAPLAAEPAEPPIPAVQPTAPTVTDVGSAAETGSAEAEAEAEIEIEVDDPPTVAPPKKHTRRRVKRERKVHAQHTGSATTPASKTAPKVQWDPTMLMPTDPQKKKKR
jgi:serine/threonine-protein kinase